MTNNNISIPSSQALVSDVVGLISLPEVYLRIRELMNDDGARLDDFANIVRIDPNLTASVLRLVNSAYFGFAGQIDTISRALNFIGIRQLHDLVLGVSAMQSFANIPNEIIDMSLFWKRSIYCGVLAGLLARECNAVESEKLFIVGLLHEIGHLVLFTKLPEQSRAALVRSQLETCNIFEIEREIFGFDYAEVGQELLKAWNLPAEFQEITAQHVEPCAGTDYFIESSIVHIAHNISWADRSEISAQTLSDNVTPAILQAICFDSTDLLPLLSQAEQKSMELSSEFLRKTIN